MAGFSVVLCMFYITEADALYGEVYNASFKPLSDTSNKMDNIVITSVIIVYLC